MSTYPEWLTDLVSWAWDRHHNVLSWWIRPLFFLPFCWFAWRRSWLGITLTVIGLITSMAWFPAPESTSAAVQGMLQSEKDYLLGDWTVWKAAIALLVPLVFAGIAAALWRRSIGWAVVVINAAILFKIAWTFFFAGTDGALAHLYPAAIGLVVINAAMLVATRWLKKRPARVAS